MEVPASEEYTFDQMLKDFHMMNEYFDADLQMMGLDEYEALTQRNIMAEEYKALIPDVESLFFEEINQLPEFSDNFLHLIDNNSEFKDSSFNE